MIDLPIRKPNRLQGYDYSQDGAYFITICAKNHAEIFGRIIAAAPAAPAPFVELSDIGEIVRTHIINAGACIDKYIIMPNHVHFIIIVDLENRATENGAVSPTKAVVPRIVNAIKGLSSKKAGVSLWQRSYYDHIIRNQDDYDRIAEYMENNPANWLEDCFYSRETLPGD